jgi:hypothetical protein
MVFAWVYFDPESGHPAEKPRHKQALVIGSEGLMMEQLHGTFRIAIKYTIFDVDGFKS